VIVEKLVTPHREATRRSHSDATVYGLSLAALAAALVVRYLLTPWIGSTLPFITVFGAVAAAVWLGGYRPAVIIGILGYVACGYILPEAGWSNFGYAELGGTVGLLAYLFTCGLIIAFGEAARSAQKLETTGREFLRVTLRSIGDGVITTDVDGRIASMNDVAASLSGWDEADAVGQPLDTVFRIVNEQNRQPVANPAIEALRDGIVVGLANHTILIRKDGGECNIDDSAAPIRDEQGNVVGSVLVFRDVTSRRKSEQAKTDELIAARLLAAIIESSDDAIISKSLTGTIQSWNAGAERIFGYSASEAVGRHISLVIPPDRLAEEDAIIASLSAGERIDHFET
jgi:PAS domain S-box-containing protein